MTGFSSYAKFSVEFKKIYGKNSAGIYGSHSLTIQGEFAMIS
jgi:hypothetical protein